MPYIDINCDMSEGFGPWDFGHDVDARMMASVTSINVAGGFHAGDPTLIAKTMALANKFGVGVGVHPGFRDLVGFGRRHIVASAEELVNDCLYQLGAVRELASTADIQLQHFKLHGALYMHAARDEEFADALITALTKITPQLPVLVMDGTVIQRLCEARGYPIVREFYADRHYDDDGRIVFTRNVGTLGAQETAEKVVRACTEGVVRTVTGAEVPIAFESVCIHSDTSGAPELLDAIVQALRAADIEIRSFSPAP